ncbi:unnamed protein product [Rhizophagus irregularis]|nr:unnamed protein product [Rhizophagus irregularis]CAB5391461.1 unnamed protein product [Rhizophagus irregularis]
MIFWLRGQDSSALSFCGQGSSALSVLRSRFFGSRFCGQGSLALSVLWSRFFGSFGSAVKVLWLFQFCGQGSLALSVLRSRFFGSRFCGQGSLALSVLRSRSLGSFGSAVKSFFVHYLIIDNSVNFFLLGL